MSSNLENTQAQMRKGVLEFCILSILANEEVYPSDIIERMKQSRLISRRGNIISIADEIKKCRSSAVPMGRKQIRTAP